MCSSDRLRDIRNLEFALFGGLSQEEFYSQPKPTLPQFTGKITGYAEMDLNTGEITCHSAKRKGNYKRKIVKKKAKIYKHPFQYI